MHFSRIEYSLMSGGLLHCWLAVHSRQLLNPHLWRQKVEMKCWQEWFHTREGFVSEQQKTDTRVSPHWHFPPLMRDHRDFHSNMCEQQMFLNVANDAPVITALCNGICMRAEVSISRSEPPALITHTHAHTPLSSLYCWQDESSFICTEEVQIAIIKLDYFCLSLKRLLTLLPMFHNTQTRAQRGARITSSHDPSNCRNSDGWMLFHVSN